MNSKDTRRYEMFVRVSTFGETHGDLFAQSPLAREQFTALAGAVEQLEEHAGNQLWTAHGGKSPKAAARAALLEQLAAFIRTARALSVATPGLEDRFRFPDRQSDQALIAAGRLFAREAEPYKDQFVTHAMPPTLIDDMTAMVDRFERAIREREVTRGGRTAARASIEEALATGAAALQQIDAIVTNQLRDDPVTMRVWRQARRVAAVPRARGTVTDPAPPPEAMPPQMPPETTGVTS